MDWQLVGTAWYAKYPRRTCRSHLPCSEIGSCIPSLQFFLNGSQPGSHPISARLPLELEDAPSGPATDVASLHETEKIVR